MVGAGVLGATPASWPGHWLWGTDPPLQPTFGGKTPQRCSLLAGEWMERVEVSPEAQALWMHLQPHR